MSFADELRKVNPQPGASRQVDQNVESFVSTIMPVIQRACHAAAAAGQQCVSGYVHYSSDDGYGDYDLARALPVVADVVANYQKQAAELNRARKYADGGAYSVGTGTQETPVYQGYMFIPNDLSRAQQVRQRLMEELGKLGFTRYNVQLQTLEDITVVYKITASLFSRRATAAVTTKKGPDSLYVPHIEVAW